MCYRCERGYLEILRFFDSLLNTLTEKLGQEIAKIQAVIAVEFLSEFERLFEEKYPLKRIRGGVTAVEEDHERKKRKIEEYIFQTGTLVNELTYRLEGLENLLGRSIMKHYGAL